MTGNFSKSWKYGKKNKDQHYSVCFDIIGPDKAVAE